MNLKNSLPNRELRYEYLTLAEAIYRAEQLRELKPNPLPDFGDGDPILLVFPYYDEFIKIVDKMNHLDFVLNVWIVFTDSSDDEAAADDELRKAVVSKLNLRSMLFFYGEESLVFTEWYKIGLPDSTLVRQELAKINRDGQFEFVADEYIWDRRADLRGHTLRTAYLQNYPFGYTVILSKGAR